MQVFISHVPQDRDLARKLADELVHAGVEVWNAEEEIYPGDNWAKKIGQALEQSDAMVAVVSRHALKSGTLRADIQFALTSANYGGRVIPVLDGEVKLTIKEPVTHGESFDPDKLKDKDKVVVTDAKDHCILNCSGTDEFHAGTAAPTWEISVKSPIRYDVRVYDNLGQFVSRSEGEMTEADWVKLAKTGDSAALHIKLVPVSREGQQLATGAYLMHANITAMGDLVTKSASGESIIVKNGKTEYLKRFGYVRR